MSEGWNIAILGAGAVGESLLENWLNASSVGMHWRVMKREAETSVLVASRSLSGMRRTLTGHPVGVFVAGAEGIGCWIDDATNAGCW